MFRNKTMKLVVGGLFIALGILFPMFTGHAFGMAGTVLLPMHIPVLIAGFLLGPWYGLALGTIIPFLSSLLTGMPPVFPMMPRMVLELAAYGLVAGYLRRSRHLPLYVTLVVAMIAGRIVNGLTFALFMTPNLGLATESVIGGIVTGIPGILIQLALIPPLVRLLENALGHKKALPIADKVLDQAIADIQAGHHTIVLIKNGEAIYRSSGPGVRPFLVLLDTAEGREMLQGSVVVDKLIGKGAAMLATLGGAESVYGVTMSESGKAFLTKHQKLKGYTRCIDVISNRQRDGICPIERSVKEVEDPQEALQIIKATVQQLMAQKAS